MVDETVASTELGGARLLDAQLEQANALPTVIDAIFGTNIRMKDEDVNVMDPYLQSIEETGLDDQGNKPGFKPNWPGYKFISSEGEIFKRHFGPEHWGEALLQDLGSAFAFDAGMRKLMGGVGLLNKASQKANYLRGFYTSVGKKQYQKGLTG